MLVQLWRMSKAGREEYTWFGLYLWEKKRSKGRNLTVLISSLNGGLTTTFAGAKVSSPKG